MGFRATVTPARASAAILAAAVPFEPETIDILVAVYEAALADKDYAAQVFMQWFINEQVEEEAWSLEMVERVQAATCAGGFSDLDRHIERYLADEAPSEA